MNMMDEAVNYFDRMINVGMNTLRKRDIELGAMDENYKPFNHLLSTEDNKRCWEFLAKQFIMNIINDAVNKGNVKASNEDALYEVWILFLQEVENVVRYGQKNKGIENIVNHSGISRETFIKFLD